MTVYNFDSGALAANRVAESQASTDKHTPLTLVQRNTSRHFPLLVLAAFLILELFLLVVVSGGRWTLLRGSRSYERIADEFSAGAGVVSTYRPPAYPLVIASIKMIFSSHWQEILFLAHCALALGSAVLIFLIAERAGRSRRVGWLALSLYLSHVLLQLELITARETALYLFLELALFYSWTRLRYTPFSAFALGALCGVAHLTRPNGVFLWLTLLGTTVVAMSKKESLGKMLAVSCASAVGFFLVLFPWQLKLRESTGKWFVTSSTSGGLNLWKGNNRFTSHLLPWLEVDELDPQARLLVPGGDITRHESDKILSELAWEHIFNHPFKSMTLAFKKGALLFAPLPIPWGTGVINEENGEILIDDFKPRKGWILFSFHTCIMYLGLGLLAVHRRRQVHADNQLLLIAVGALVVFSFCLHAVTFPETRLRLPLDAILIVFSAIGFKGAYARWLVRPVPAPR